MLPFYEVQEHRIKMGPLRPSFYFPAHLHVECEMIWVRRGYMRMRADEIAYTIGEGEVFLIAPNEVHAYDSSSADVEGRLLMFHPEEVGALPWNLLRTRPRHPLIAAQEVPERLWQALDWLEEERNEDCEQAMRSLLTLMMGKLYPLTQPEPTKVSQEQDLIRRALTRIHETYQEDLAQEDLAHELGVTHWYLSHLFNSHLKMGYRTYVNALRVEQAKRLLVSTDMPITEIVYQCGFNSQSCFNRAFRSWFHTTPRAMREEEKKAKNF